MPFVSLDGNDRDYWWRRRIQAELAAAINRLLDDQAFAKNMERPPHAARERNSVLTTYGRSHLELYREVIADGRIGDGEVQTRAESIDV